MNPAPAGGTTARRPPGHPAELFTRSALAAGTEPHGVSFARWWEQRGRAASHDVRQVPFDALDQWHFGADDGNLRHTTGRYFSVEGVRFSDGAGRGESRPIIRQAEVGILGILVKEFDGVPHCLMQAKFEPGNLNGRQLSPTVQATRSNFARVHRGRPTPYVEYFRDAAPDRVLVDVLQSEQGAWFWHKRNRNMVVRVGADEPVPEHEDFHWMSLGDLRTPLRTDDLVNMDTRTVLSCMPMAPGEEGRTADSAFRHALRRSYAAGSGDLPARHGMAEIRSWLTGERAACAAESRLIALRDVTGWRRGADEITDDAERGFRILGVRVRAEGREVAEWSQPLLGTRGPGLSAFLVRDIGGTLHALVRASTEPGLMGLVELGPTVQAAPSADVRADLAGVPFAGAALSTDPRRVHYDALLSEEGGRFHHTRNRYRIVEAGDDAPLEEPPGFRWMSTGQLGALVRHSNYLNIEARSLLACLHTLW